MAQVTIHKEPGVTVEVIDGFPPADQSAIVAEQESRIATLQAELDTAEQSAESWREAVAAAVAERNVLAAKIEAVKAALAGLTA